MYFALYYLFLCFFPHLASFVLASFGPEFPGLIQSRKILNYSRLLSCGSIRFKKNTQKGKLPDRKTDHGSGHLTLKDI